MIESGFNVSLLVLDTSFKNHKEKYLKYINYYYNLLFFNYSNYDHIYIHNYPYSFLPLINKFKEMKKITIHWHGTDIFSPTKKGLVLNHISYKFIPKTCQHIVPSNYFADKVSEKLGIKRDRIFVSPSGGVDTNIFKPKKKKREEKEIILGFASSMRTDKGIDLVLKLVQDSKMIQKKLDKKIKFICIKYGLEKELYSKELSKYNNVEIISPLPKDKMINFYHQIDLLLLPTKMPESLALVGLEAMSCNIPVIGTDDFALKEYIINDVSGERFEKDNFESFKNAVIKAIQNIKKYSPRKIVLSNYSKKYVINQYKKYFGEI
ncbi:MULTISPECIES: glycosyltransferase family 4 protein [unclassified Nitratiruptor]|uniref:glycosyltransferase family 4 protein n=1 Tax=unclassified Nitratiruptor TaxID=2624044 RepID=UPI0019159F50|nr:MULTISPECIES: glycosyltransferase family 4 protein [unclassified Nitratiruptor]